MIKNEKEQITHSAIMEMTAEIVSAYAVNNNLTVSELKDLIPNVYSSLKTVSKSDISRGGYSENRIPAVPAKKSVHDDFIICLEDGKKFKSLKRHLNSQYGLTPIQYREKWGLAADYPMVAPNYAKQRSQLAKEFGLGRKNEDSGSGET